MKKSLHELLTYIWIPFMLGLVFYIFRDRHDVPLAIITLIAFSAVYTIVRLYFAHKRWWLLVTVPVILVGFVTYILVRPQGITLSINGQAVTSSIVSFTEGSVSVNPPPGDDGKYAKGTVVTLTASPAPGYRFDHWEGDASGNVTTVIITMNSNKSITATFIKISP